MNKLVNKVRQTMAGLLICMLLLESCSINGNGSLPWLEKQEAVVKSPIPIPSSNIDSVNLLNTILNWKSRQGHILHRLYQGQDGLRGMVQDKASAEVVHDLPVYIFPDISLDKIATYPAQKIAHHLHIQLASQQSQGAIIMSPGGLQGGGNPYEKGG